MLRLVARGRGAARGDCDRGDELARRRGARSLGERRRRGQRPPRARSCPAGGVPRKGAARTPARPPSGCDAHHGHGRRGRRSGRAAGARLARRAAGRHARRGRSDRRARSSSSARMGAATRVAPASASRSSTRWHRTSPPERLWQSSHLGGHRFAPNVLVLPHGVQLGRIPLERAAEVARLLERRPDPARSLSRPHHLRACGTGRRDRRARGDRA